MKRLFTRGMVALSAAALILAAFHFIRAQGHVPNTAEFDHPLAAPHSDASSNPVAHQLGRTYMIEGFPDTLEAAGFAKLESSPTTIGCWVPCTLEVELNGGVGGVSYTGNTWTLGISVDGGFPDGPFIGTVPSDLSNVTGSVAWSFSLKPGTHTVQSYVWTEKGAYLQYFHGDYRVYFP